MSKVNLGLTSIERCRRFRAILLPIAALSLLAAGCGGGSSSAPPPDFGIAASPGSLTVAPGGAAVVQISLSALNGFSGNVNITVTGAPAGVTFAPALPVALALGQQSLSIFVSGGTATGQYSLNVQGSAGTLQHSAPLTLMVQQGAFASFSVSVNSTELSVNQGSSVSTIAGLSIASQSGSTNFAVQFSVSGLPNGVQATFAANPLIISQPATSLTFSAISTATLANDITVTVIGTRTADGVQETATLTFSVLPPTGSLSSIRTDFIRMDGTPVAAVYDAARQLIYASDPEWNRVDVISPATRQVTATIPVPNPSGMDLSADGTLLRVGSGVEQITTIGTASLQVTSRASVTPFVQGGATYSIPALLASTTNGSVLVGMTLDSDPPAYFLEQWSPSAGTFTPRSAPGVTAFINRMVRSFDGSKVLVVDYGSDLNLAVYDSGTDSFPTSGQSTVGQVLYAAASPTQDHFAVLGTNGISVVDAQLNTVATTTAGLSPVANNIYGIVFSADGTKLYVVNLYSQELPLIEVYDAQTLAFLGEAPAFQTEIPYFATFPVPNELATPTAIDNTGRIISLFSHGVVLDDPANLQNLISLPVVPGIGQIGPANEAPLNATLATTLGQEGFSVVPDVWFDNTRATSIQLSGPQVNLTAPASATAGIVNVKAVTPDGWFSFTPQAFSYGTEIFYLGGNAGGAGGGATLDLIGHGFLTNTSVTVGGQPAEIQSSAQYASETEFPFVGIDHLRVKVPAGTAGAADVTVTSASGSATLVKAFQYLASVTDYPSADTLTFALYDSGRRQVYVSAGNHVDVFSGDTLQFLSAIVPPTVSGTLQLRGLALTPDGSKLVIANFSDSSVAIVDPDNPSSGNVVKIPVTIANSPGVNAVAATSTGKVFVDGVSGTFSGCGAQLWEIDLPTLHVTLRTDSSLACLQMGGVHFSSDSAGDKVLIASPNGGAYLWSASSDQFVSTGLVSDNGAASGDGVWFASDYTLLDAQMIQRAAVQVPEFFFDPFIGPPNGAVPGEQMNSSGSLVYAPLQDGVDILDTSHGSWIGRILLSEKVPVVQNAMALDETGNRLFLITHAGLTVVPLGPTQLSIGYLSPATGTSAGGTAVTLRGSGFQTGITVSVGGAQVSASFVDSSTLTFTTRAGTAGGAQVVLENPDGTTYKLDAGFIYQ
jgi:IPT/TIG domain